MWGVAKVAYQPHKLVVRGSNPLPATTMKIKYQNTRGTRVISICSYCGEEFQTLATKVRAGKEKFCCNECYRQYRKKYSYNPKERNVLYQKKTKYGLTESEYKELFKTQDNKCLICGDSFDNTKAFVDHDHLTGKVRGLLCTRCNSLLGMCKDNVDILKSAITYLER